MRRLCLTAAALLTLGAFTGCSSNHRASNPTPPKAASHVHISAGDTIGATLYSTNQRRSVASGPNE